MFIDDPCLNIISVVNSACDHRPNNRPGWILVSLYLSLRNWHIVVLPTSGSAGGFLFEFADSLGTGVDNRLPPIWLV